MKRVFLKNIFMVALGFILSVFYLPALSADEPMSQIDDVIDMITGDIETIPVNGLTRVSLTNPSVADISDAQSDKVTIVAKSAGNTVLFLWDAGGKRSMKVRVVSEDLSVVKARVQKVLEEANITGVTLEENSDIGKVVLSGSLSKDDKNRLTDTLEPYSESLLNLVKLEKNEDLIQVDMQVVEISTTVEQNLGILWGSGTTTGSAGASSGSSGSTGVALGYNENQPTGDSFGDLFKIGKFQRTTPLQATVNALLQEGKARLISKPRLVVVSGKQASFLVGGEIPVESTTSNTTGSTLTQNTTYTQYGVNMTVTPTIRDGKIEVLLNVDIRDIDASNSSNGNVAFITRTASTNLLMDNKQTIVLAGLIKYTDSKQSTEVPFLSKIPVLGLLFRDTTAPDTNTEMVIILTPTVLTSKKFADSQVVMPTPEERNAGDEVNLRYEHEPLPSWPASKAMVDNPSPGLSAVLPAMTAYARMVQERISKAISYPHLGMGSALAGTVKLKLHILRDGSLDSEEVMESSGNDILDQDAMQAAKTAAPYDAFSPAMDQDDIIFTVPIIYNRLVVQGQTPTGKVIASY